MWVKKVALDKKLLQGVAAKSEAENVTEQSVLAKESARLLDEAISKLPAQQQLIYKLNKVEGYSYNEIADKLHLSPNTVRNHLATAMKSIRIYLRDYREFTLIFGILIRFCFEK